MPEKFVQKNQEQVSAVSKERLGRDLFATINKLSQDVSQGLERRKEEILTWPEETKEVEAGTSDDLLVINLLSKQPDLNTRTAIALNPNIPSGVTRRFIEDDNEMLIPLSINPNLSRGFIEMIITKEKEFSDASMESILYYLLSNHPECTELLKKKYDTLNTKHKLDSEDVDFILSSHHRLPRWIGTILKRDGFLKEIVLNIGSFVDPNGVLSELTLGSDKRQLKTIMDYLLETEGVKGLVLSNELADEFISKGQGVWVLDNISLFPSLSLDRVFATKLLKAEYVDTLAENIKLFNFDDPKQFLEKIILFHNKWDGGYGRDRSVAELIKNIAISHDAFYEFILKPSFLKFFVYKIGERDILKEIIEKCSNKDLFNQDVANALIDLDSSTGLYNGKLLKILENNIDVFKITDYRLLIAKILEKENFSNCELELIIKIIKMSNLVLGNSEATIMANHQSSATFICENLENFDGLSEEIAIKLISDDFYKKVRLEKIIDSLEKFSDIGYNFIIALIRNDLMNDQVIKKITELKGFDISNFEKAIMESKPTVDGARTIMQNPELFKIMNDAKTFLLYISNIYPKNSGLFFENLDRLSILGFDCIAEEMIKAGLGFEVVRNLERFKGVDRKRIVELLSSVGEKEYIERNFSEFIRKIDFDKNLPGDYQLRGALESEQPAFNQKELVADYIEKFDDVVPDKTQLIVDLIREGKHRHFDTSIWMFYLEKFKGLDFRNVALALLNYDRPDYERIKLDKNIDDQTIINKLIENGHSSFFLDYFKHFKNINVNDFVIKIIESGQPLTLFYYLTPIKESLILDLKLSGEVVLDALTKMGELMDRLSVTPDYFSDLEQTKEFMLKNINIFDGLTEDSIEEIFGSLRSKEKKKKR